MVYNHLLADGSPVTVPHIETQYYLPIVDRILEPQTIAQFVGFAFGKPLPDGTRPSWLPSLFEDEASYFRGSEDEQQTSIMTSVMSRIGSNEDGERLCVLGKNIASLKTRLWEGIVPMSEEWWDAQGLNEEGKLEEATQHLGAVVAVFEYLNTPEVQGNLRETFNLIYAHWEGLDAQISVQRKERGEKESISVASLWTTYMASHFRVMSNRAHQWVARKVDELRAPILQALLEHENPIGVPDATQWKLTNGLHLLLEISVRADYTIMIPMDGYKGYTNTPPTNEVENGLYSPDLTERQKVYPQRVKRKSHQIMIEKMLERVDRGGVVPQQTSGEQYHESAMEQVEAQVQVRRELRGEEWDVEIREPWISSFLKGAQKGDDAVGEKVKREEEGFVVYRLTYGQGKDEWAEFVERVERDIASWGRGSKGSEDVKPFLKLRWVDGKEVGITEGDIEAAKEHFNKNFASDDDDKDNDNDNDEKGGDSETKKESCLYIQRAAFLAIDSASFTSYAKTNSKTHPFILSVDPSFIAAEGPSRPDESPNYPGHVRITPSLLWPDVFAHFQRQSASLEDLWPLAMHHPQKVYIGPIIPLHFKEWGVNISFGRVLFQMFMGSLRGMITGVGGWIAIALLGVGGWWYLRRGGR